MLKIFVYGTLKKGFRANDMLQKWDADYIGPAKTAPQYKLYEVNWFPGMVFDQDFQDGGVEGELYNVSEEAMRSLDRYEGAPSLFRRDEIELDDGEKVIAYIFNGNTSELKLVENGIWSKGKLE